MTPEEIQRQAAARNSAGQLGEARQRALPAPTPRAPGTSIATAPQPRPSAPTAGNALATTAQPAPEPITGTARTVNRPQPTIFVDSQGNAGTTAQRIDQSTRQRMATERAARLDAMNRGGIGALDDVARQQQGPAGPARAGIGVAPAAAPSAPASAPSAAVRAGQAARTATDAIGRVARAGAAPVNPAAVGGKLAQIASVPGVVATTGMVSAGTSMGTGTDDYYRRLMIDPKNRPDGALGLASDVGVRTVGALSDLGAGVLDIGTGAVNLVRGMGGAQPIESFRDIMTAPERAARGESPRQASAPPAAAPPDIGSVPAPASRRAEQPAAPAAAPAGGDRVVGTFNGREIRASEAQRLADTNVVPAAAMQSLARAPAAQQDNGQGQLLAMLNQARGDRMSVQSGASERLQGLYEKFNDQISQGRRRTAAVIGEQIRAELGVLGQTANGQMIDPRQPGQVRDEAEAGRIGEVTAGQRLENQARERLSALEAIITNPEATEEQRAQAATQYQLLTGRGGQQQEDARIVQLPGPDGFTTVPALLPRGSTQAIPITAAGGQQQPGLTMIGTSGGKPVYRDAQGNTFIDE